MLCFLDDNMTILRPVKIILLFFSFYTRFVSSVLPPGMQDLSGSEVDTIVAFKNALGIDDPEAASMHMEVLY